MGARPRAVALFGALVLIAAACDWSTVGFDASRGGYSAFDRHLTVDNVGGLSERWKADAGNQASAPVVGDGRVFISHQPTADAPGGLAAFDATGTGCTGPAPATCPSLWSNSFSGVHGNPAISPPLLTKDYVSASGAIPYDFYYGGIPIPITALESVGGAFDPQSGTAVPGASRTGAAPAISVNGATYGYTTVLQRDFTYRFIVNDAVTYLVATVPGGSDFVILETPLTQPSSSVVGSAPAVADGTLFVLRSDKLQAYDAHGNRGCLTEIAGMIPYHCTPLWTAVLSQPGAFDGMPAIAKGRVYVPELNGAVEVFDAAGCGAATCAASWVEHAGNQHVVPVAVTDTTLFVSSDDGHLYAFDSAGCAAATCEPKWSASIPSGPHAPSIAGSVLFLGTSNGTVAAFNVDGCGQATCNPLWSANVGAPITTAPAIADGRVFVTDTNGTIHAFGLA